MKKKLLLHSCCGPCSTAVIDRLKDEFDLTILYYNPSIYPQEEYIHRFEEQKRYAKECGLKIEVIDGGYTDCEMFYTAYAGHEDEPEGSKRCEICFRLRLNKTAEFAKTHSFEIFATTLTVSPHKNATLINQIGTELGAKHNIEYLQADFKKKDGFLTSIKLAKKFNLYRQNYCGCKFSIHQRAEH